VFSTLNIETAVCFINRRRGLGSKGDHRDEGWGRWKLFTPCTWKRATQ